MRLNVELADAEADELEAIAREAYADVYPRPPSHVARGNRTGVTRDLATTARDENGNPKGWDLAPTQAYRIEDDDGSPTGMSRINLACLDVQTAESEPNPQKRAKRVADVTQRVARLSPGARGKLNAALAKAQRGAARDR